MQVARILWYRPDNFNEVNEPSLHYVIELMKSFIHSFKNDL